MTKLRMITMANKTHQFYGDSGTVTLGFYNGDPYVSANPLLQNPTDKKKYDYDKQKSIFFVFTKLSEMARIIESLESLIIMNVEPNGDAKGELFVKKWNYNTSSQEQVINLFKNNTFSSKFFSLIISKYFV